MHYTAAGHRRRRRMKVKARIWLMIGIPVVFMFFVFLFQCGVQAGELRAQAEEKQREINDARIAQTELERKYAFLQTDQYIEQEARRRFGFLKSGEIRYMIDDSSVVSGVVSAWQQEIQALTGDAVE